MTQVTVEAADDTPRRAIRTERGKPMNLRPYGDAAMDRDPERGKPMKMGEMGNGPQQFTAIHDNRFFIDIFHCNVAMEKAGPNEV
jgi:hypothetical protein